MTTQITIACEGASPVKTTLGDFLADNDGAFDDGEIADMRAALDAGKEYRGGGGASMAWTLRAAS